MLIAADMSWVKLEPLLLTELENVQWIGELAIDRESFHSLATILRRGFVSSGELHIEQCRPALFVTSMVFCARYSDSNAREFWRPYSQLVWGLSSASQTFQNRCRSHFSNCIRTLCSRFPFSFPQDSSGDVVRPVYRHAIIPYHLQDDFARWIKDRWSQFVEFHEGTAHELLLDSSIRYLGPTLQTFLQSVETRDTALALIRDMAKAIGTYAQGESAENIRQQLVYTPIQSELWNELERTLEAQIAPRREHRPSHQIQWVWTFEQNDMQIRVLNLALTGARPDRLVWVKKDEDPLQADIIEYLNPWREGKERWLIDEATLSCSTPEDYFDLKDGSIMLLGEDDSTLATLPVPPLPNSPAIIFRSTQQNVYGVEVDPQKRPITDGYWVVSMAEGTTILDAEGRPVLCHETLEVPALLAQINQHKHAGVYRLELPVAIRTHDTVIELERQILSATSPILHGSGNQVEGLAPSVPPAFNSTAIWVELTGVSRRLITLGTLWLKSPSSNRGLPLGELEQMGWLQLDEDVMTIDLARLLPNAPGVYVLEIKQGLHSVFPSPVQLSLVLGLTILSPDLEEVYGLKKPPVCRIIGLQPEEIVSDRRTIEAELIDGVTHITWKDLRQPCSLALHLKEELIPLTWNVKRALAWVEGAASEGTLSIEDLKTTRLNIIAPPEDRHSVYLWIEGGRKRAVPLSAKGLYSSIVANDPLFDMILEHPVSIAEVYVGIAGHTQKVLEVQHTPEITEPQVVWSEEERRLVFSCSIDFEWWGRFTFRVRSLSDPSALPVEKRTTSLSASQAIPLTLTPGLYLLEILREEDVINLDRGRMMFSVGSAHHIEPDTDISLITYLAGEQVRVPASHAADFLRAIDPSTQFSSLRLYQLATLPGMVYTSLHETLLERLWPPLVYVALAQDIVEWEACFGLLPAWAVLREAIRLIPRRNEHAALSVFPERALSRGRQGAGYVLMSFRTSGAGNKVYIRWWPDEKKDITLVKLGIPDRPESRCYADIDEQDIWPVYQCAQCGGFATYQEIHEHNSRGPVPQFHMHGQQKYHFIDTLNCNPMTARLENEPGKLLRYTAEPSESVDRSIVSSFSKGHRVASQSSDSCPISVQFYRHAMWKWMERYQAQPDTRDKLDRLMADSRLRKGLDHVRRQLLNSGHTYAASHAATARLLAVLGFDAAGPRIDTYVVLLAFLLRQLAYRPEHITSQLSESGLGEREVINTLGTLNAICPELLLWALTWSEHFYVHAAS